MARLNWYMATPLPPSISFRSKALSNSLLGLLYTHLRRLPALSDRSGTSTAKNPSTARKDRKPFRTSLHAPGTTSIQAGYKARATNLVKRALTTSLPRLPRAVLAGRDHHVPMVQRRIRLRAIRAAVRATALRALQRAARDQARQWM